MSTPVFKKNKLSRAIALGAAFSIPLLGAYSRPSYASCTGSAGTYLCEGALTTTSLSGSPLVVTTSGSVTTTNVLELYGQGGITFTDLDGAASQLGGLDAGNFGGGNVSIETNATFDGDRGIRVYNYGAAGGSSTIAIDFSGNITSPNLGITAYASTGSIDIRTTVDSVINSVDAGISAHAKLGNNATTGGDVLVDLKGYIASQKVGVFASNKLGAIDVNMSSEAEIDAEQGIVVFSEDGHVNLDIGGHIESESIGVGLIKLGSGNASVDISGSVTGGAALYSEEQNGDIAIDISGSVDGRVGPYSYSGLRVKTYEQTGNTSIDVSGAVTGGLELDSDSQSGDIAIDISGSVEGPYSERDYTYSDDYGWTESKTEDGVSIDTLALAGNTSIDISGTVTGGVELDSDDQTGDIAIDISGSVDGHSATRTDNEPGFSYDRSYLFYGLEVDTSRLAGNTSIDISGTVTGGVELYSAEQEGDIAIDISGSVEGQSGTRTRNESGDIETFSYTADGLDFGTYGHSGNTLINISGTVTGGLELYSEYQTGDIVIDISGTVYGSESEVTYNDVNGSLALAGTYVGADVETFKHSGNTLIDISGAVTGGFEFESDDQTGDIAIAISGSVDGVKRELSYSGNGSGYFGHYVSYYGHYLSDVAAGLEIDTESQVGDIDVNISGSVQGGELAYAISIGNADSSGIHSSAGVEIRTDRHDGDINVTVAEGGSITSTADGLRIASAYRVDGLVHVTVAGTISAGENFDAISVQRNGSGAESSDVVLELQSGWALNGDVNIDAAAATLVLSGSKASSLDLSRLTSSVEPDGSRIYGITDFVKTGSSTFALSGTPANFDGFNSAEVTGGTLALENATFAMAESAPALAVSAESTLSFNNATVIGDVNSDGVLAVGPGAGTITGDFNQSATGTLRVDVVSDSSYGQLVVEGTATFADNANIVVNLANTRTSFTSAVKAGLPAIITAGTLESKGFSVTDNSALFDFDAEVASDGNQVDLKLTPLLAFGGIEAIVAGDPSSLPAAAVLDRLINDFLDTQDAGAFAAAIDAFAQLDSEEAVSNAVSQLIPMLSGASPQVVSQLSFALDRIVQQRQGRTGAASGDGFLTEGNLWLKPFGSWAKQDRRDGISGFDADSYGLAMGADTDLDSKRSVGMALVYANTKVDSTSTFAPQSSEVASYQVRVYGAQTLAPATVLHVQADLGYHRTDGERAIQFGNLQYRAKSDYDSNSFHLGTAVTHGLWAKAGSDFSIAVAADYSWVRDSGYQEKGAEALSLKVSEDRSEELLLSVDGRYNYLWGEHNLISANVGIGYDLIDDHDGVTSAFAGAPGLTFRTPGLDQDPLLVRAGLGFKRQVNDGLQTSVRYDVETRDDFSNQTASFNLRWSF